MARKLGEGAVPLFVCGGKGPHLTQCCLGEAYLHIKWRLIHPAVWPKYTNVTDRTGQTGQPTTVQYSIGRAVLQTVTQKLQTDSTKNRTFRSSLRAVKIQVG